MKNILFLLAFCILYSCNKKKEENVQKQDTTSLLSVVKSYKAAEKVNPIFLKEIESWQELKAVDEFLSRFNKVSSNEILSNAFELKELVQSLKDGVKPPLFDNDSFITRIDILHNETLRLVDMTFIPAITADEVAMQTKNIINAFSAINAKVTSILLKERFEDEMEFDVQFIGLDSTNIDSISRVSIHKKSVQRKDKMSSKQNQ
ncbi:hypothetical protein [uncultured Polaribacter sp.]|uniref:hypothetical protein n=1 Tax=uncultured Polaribacter sp. TaxID=174711 RepID=UPI0030D844F7